ncbi:low molecular weight phosphotyrosine protein phosphatase [Verrucomicrobiaceae bacterium N1E253]|uniref:Low molecular weight phosphotyrosine protein phosphatase n=1 Tax=Oceaniferula marina TaxID=2748318 RepID=A0A851GIN7_9BACT|nr:low molecular weight protein-tyrosine-phosphatase [Oceaniferula marina]NWK54500.1 low molecular weight phosphotyrosine protein phosphatase [Oceaniferula marina]
MTPPPYRVLFVCMGNICRSPAGENIFRHQVQQAGLEDSILIDSAGTIDYHVGHQPDRRMCQTLKSRGIASEGSARHFTAQDFIDFDLILTMDEENYHNVTKLDPEGKFRDKVKRFTSFCRQEEHRIKEVPDPYYGGNEGFEFVADILEDGSRALLEYVRNQG